MIRLNLRAPKGDGAIIVQDIMLHCGRCLNAQQQVDSKRLALLACFDRLKIERGW